MVLAKKIKRKETKQTPEDFYLPLHQLLLVVLFSAAVTP